MIDQNSSSLIISLGFGLADESAHALLLLYAPLLQTRLGHVSTATQEKLHYLTSRPTCRRTHCPRLELHPWLAEGFPRTRNSVVDFRRATLSQALLCRRTGFASPSFGEAAPGGLGADSPRT